MFRLPANLHSWFLLMGRVLRISIYELTNRSTMYDRSIGVRGGGGGGGAGGAAAPPKKV